MLSLSIHEIIQYEFVIEKCSTLGMESCAEKPQDNVCKSSDSSL